MFLAVLKSMMLLEAECFPNLPALLHSVTVTFEESLNDDNDDVDGVLGLDCETPPKYPCSKARTPNRSPSSSFLP